MKAIRLVATLGAIALVAATRVDAVVVNFDDLAPGGAVIAMPLNYGGISWDSPNFGVYGFVQAPYTPSSPPNRALVNRVDCCPTEEIKFSFAEPVVFGGAWFAGIDELGLVVKLYLGGGVVHTTSSLFLSSTPTLWGNDYAGAVDEVGILSTRGFYVFDDVTYEAVPEPTTLALLGAGAAVVLRRRRKAS